MTKVQEIWLFIVAALGGSSVLTACVIRKGASFLSDVFLKGVEIKYEQIIEKYKAQLERETNKLNALTSKILHVAESQYDKEFEIYLNIWDALTDCRKGLNSVIEKIDLDRPAYAYEDQRSILNDCLKAYLELYVAYENKVDKYAPFYKKNFYEKLINIKKEFLEIIQKMDEINILDLISSESEVAYLKNKIIIIDNEKQMLEDGIREYLQGLQVL